MAKKKTKKPIKVPVNRSDAVQQTMMAPNNRFPFKMKTAYRTGRLAFLLGIVSCIIYANTLSNGFVLDDPSVITKNTIVTKGISAIPQILVTPYRRGLWKSPNDLYRPLSLVTFAIEYQLWGDTPAPYHL
jgi:hypothetical protein